jgi:3-dehydroquinate dehydratase type I
MHNLPFYIVPLTHPDWEDARLYAKRLPPVAIPELRLDLLPDLDPEPLVDSLKRRCVVSCRRAADGGAWPDWDEGGRLERLSAALRGRPLWLDIEWDLEIPGWLDAELTHTRLIRSVHAAPEVFDLETRLGSPPRGDAYKWVGRASRLSDNARLKGPLSWARERRVALSAFLTGGKGVVSRCMQAAWGGAFTYAAPDNAEGTAPGQVRLETMMSWRCHKLHPGHGICGVLGTPLSHSPGPEFHNPRLQRAFKDLVYLPLEADDAAEAMEAMETLPVLGASVTMPLKETLAESVGAPPPANTLWRRAAGDAWGSANTDAEALSFFLAKMRPGPVLVLGGGGAAKASLAAAEKRGIPAAAHSRCAPLSPLEVARLAPAGVVQATSLGMAEGDPLPFPGALDAALPTLAWAIEWVNRSGTAFCEWATAAGLALVGGRELFVRQAEAQSGIFVRECGG